MGHGHWGRGGGGGGDGDRGGHRNRGRDGCGYERWGVSGAWKLVGRKLVRRPWKLVRWPWKLDWSWKLVGRELVGRPWKLVGGPWKLVCGPRKLVGRAKEVGLLSKGTHDEGRLRAEHVGLRPGPEDAGLLEHVGLRPEHVGLHELLSRRLRRRGWKRSKRLLWRLKQSKFCTVERVLETHKEQFVPICPLSTPAPESAPAPGSASVLELPAPRFTRPAGSDPVLDLSTAALNLTQHRLSSPWSSLVPGPSRPLGHPLHHTTTDLESDRRRRLRSDSAATRTAL